MNKKVSIIVPVYNCENQLRRCLKSILEQTYYDIECILINDGSTDSSGKICDEYKKIDKRVKVVHQSNKGVSTSRNVGIHKSTGYYISFVDSDDTIAIDMIECMIKQITSSELLICGYNKYLNQVNNDIQLEIMAFKKNQYNLDIKKFMYSFHKYFEHKIINSVCNKLYKKNIILENSVFFLPEILMGEDTIFNMKYLEYCNHITVIDKPLYNYYLEQDQESLSSVINEDRIYSQKLMYDIIEKTLEKYNALTRENREYIYIEKYNDLISSFKLLNHKLGDEKSEAIYIMMSDELSKGKPVISSLFNENKFIASSIMNNRKKTLFLYLNMRKLLKKYALLMKR